jgi:transcriptional regulator GlxA family with amidase domain
MSEHRACFIIYPGVASYDVAGPAQAQAVVGPDKYEVTLLSVTGGVVESDCPGLSFSTKSTADAPERIDTLFIPGGIEAPTAAKDPVLIEEVKRLAARAERVACVCTGAFLAAEATLLTGRHVATHWRYCDLFAERYPDVMLERDRIWVRDLGTGHQHLVLGRSQCGRRPYPCTDRT